MTRAVPTARPTTAPGTAPERRRRLRAAVAALAVLAAAVGVVAVLPVEQASASRLDVQASPAAVVARTACTSTAVTVVPTAVSAPTAVVLEGLSSADETACAGRPVEVTLFGASGVLGTAAGTLTSATQTYALSGAPTPSAVTRVRVLVGGFAVPATWRVPGPPPDSCWVADANGSPVARSCTVTGHGAPNFWQEGGYWKVYWKVTFSAPGIANDEHVEFEFTVPDTAVPASGWSWSNARVVSANNGAVVESRCAELPTIRGELPPRLGELPEVQVMLTDNPGTPPVCRP